MPSSLYIAGLGGREDDLAKLLRGGLGRESEFEFEDEFEFEFEGERELNPTQLADAVRANRAYARQIGWGWVIGGRVVPSPELNTRLGIAAGASEEDIARAIERWQVANLGGRGDGKLGPMTWSRMRLFPDPRYRQQRWAVNYGGHQLGVIEKTRAYTRQESATHFGVEIEMGFRVTNMDAVQRAGFVDAGEDQFRWIQVIELRRLGVPSREVQVQTLRRRAGGRIIDPTSALLTPDQHPYYWYEDHPPSPGFHISNYLNTQGDNRLCYDLLFYDRPNIPKAAAQPGRRAYFNFETALVGVRPGHRNVILNTVLWGFDIVLQGSVPTLSEAAMRTGPHGGSASFRRVMSAETAAGSFRGTFGQHCFVGSGYSQAAACR